MKRRGKVVSKANTSSGKQLLKNAVGYCLWLLSLPTCILLIPALFWLRYQEALLVKALFVALFIAWLRFMWTRVLRKRVSPSNCAGAVDH